MVRLTEIKIKGYRSVRDATTIKLPTGAPLVLVGENNAGKSNIVKALDVVLGEFWPGNKEPDDHEFWNRDAKNAPIEIEVGLAGLIKIDYYGRPIPIRGLLWKYDPSDKQEAVY